MYATLAGRLPRWTARPWVLFLPETFALFTVLAAPFFLFEIGWTLLAAVSIVVVGYINLSVFMYNRQNRRKFEKPPLRFELLVLIFRISFVFIVLGIFIVVVNLWGQWAYTTHRYPEIAYESIWEVLGIFVAPPVLFLTLARPWRKGTPTAEILGAVRNKGFACIRSDWISVTALTVALLCSMSIAGSVLILRPFLTQLHIGEEPSVLEMAGTFPFLPLGLLVVAAMLAIYRRMAFACMSSGAILHAYTGTDGESPIPETGTAALAVLCVWAVGIYAVLAPVHLAQVAEKSLIVGIPATLGAEEAIEEWAGARRVEGMTGAEMAAILNEHGSWNPDSPEAGLPTLFPDLREIMPVGNELGAVACSITVAAAATNPASVSDTDWLLPDQAESDLKYCVRTACPSPVAWDAPDTVTLVTSHASQNEEWVVTLFIDVFARGRAPAPGGYCTADGRLADEFQG